MSAPNTTAKRETVIVTGASGFIGAALVRRLAKRYRVAALDLEAADDLPRGASFFPIDLTDDKSVESAIDDVVEKFGERIASVVHLAAYFDLTGEPNEKYETVTVEGTERLLSALHDHQLEQFVFVSTMLVHAPTQKGRLINEESPLAASYPYRASKLQTEDLIRARQGDTPAVILRPAGIYDDECHSAFLAQQIARIYEKRLTARVYPGDASTGQPYLHLDDLLAAIERVIERRKELPPEQAILLGEEESLSYDDLQQSLGKLIHGVEWETHSIPKALAKAGAWAETEILDEDVFIQPYMVEISDDHYALDLSRAGELLDWSPEKSLRRTLPKMVESLKADPCAFYKENKLNAARIAGRVAAKSDEPQFSKAEMRKHHEQMRRMHFEMLWVHWVTLGLGFWLLFSPSVFGTFSQTEFSSAVLRVTADRELWEPALRNTLTAWNDVVCGVLIMTLACFSMSPKRGWAQWANALIGVWLLAAPIVFWTPSAAVYANDTLVGALVIAFTILIPMMPGMGMEGMMDENDIPPGWTYSPSTWLQRIPIIALGFVGFVIARILAAYQLGHIEGVWEPFFSWSAERNGTEHIITSDVSRAWPVSDGGVGAMTYMSEILMGAMGGRARWRTMPWMVLLFGIAVVPLGAVSIYFIIIQPIVIGTYCTLCLMAAAAMVIMIPYSLDELVAMGQFLVYNTKRGRPFWRTLIRGDAQPFGGVDPDNMRERPMKAIISALKGGVQFPWTLVASVAVGVALMFSRVVIGAEPPLADSDHLVGALVITTAVAAMAEVARPVRFINVAFGLWLIAAPFILGGGTAAIIYDVAAGLLLIALSLPRGKRSEEHYGGWDRFVF